MYKEGFPHDQKKYLGSQNPDIRNILSSPKDFLTRMFSEKKLGFKIPDDLEFRKFSNDRTLRKKMIVNFERIMLRELVNGITSVQDTKLEEQRAARFGITPEELEEIKKSILSGLELEEISKEINSKRTPETQITNLNKLVEDLSLDIEKWLEKQPDLVEHTLDRVAGNREAYIVEAAELTEKENVHLFDNLTGALSMAGFEMYFDDDLEQLQKEQKPGEVMLAIFFDIDSFKRVNEVIGHDGADKILIEIVEKLKAEGGLRASDRVCRRSGDEFMISAVIQETGVQNFIEKIKKIIGQVNDHGWGQEVKVTGGYTVIKPEEKPTFAGVREQIDGATIFQKVVKKGEFKKYSAEEIIPDLSSEDKLRDWAARVVRGQFYREVDLAEVTIEKIEKILENPKLKSSLNAEEILDYEEDLSDARKVLRLIDKEIEARIERKKIELKQEVRKRTRKK